MGNINRIHFDERKEREIAERLERISQEIKKQAVLLRETVGITHGGWESETAQLYEVRLSQLASQIGRQSALIKEAQETLLEIADNTLRAEAEAMEIVKTKHVK